MYELLVLGRLSTHPMHGYMIAKIIGHIDGPVRQMQWGTLYPILSRLEGEGLIRAEETVEDGDGRTRKVYAITEAGRARLHDLLLDTEHHIGDYATIFAHKVALFSELTAEERLHLSRHYAVYAQQHIDHLERKRRDISGLPDERMQDVLSVFDHRTEYWKRERAWAEQLIARNALKEVI